jgi:hypothetical protein
MAKRDDDEPRSAGRPSRVEDGPATVLIPVRAVPLERTRWKAAAKKLGTTLGDEARRAWEYMERRADALPDDRPDESPSPDHQEK